MLATTLAFPTVTHLLKFYHPLRMPQLKSAKVVSQKVSTHWTNTIRSANRQLAVEQEAESTLCDRQVLGPVRGQEGHLDAVNELNDDTERSKVGAKKRVRWAEEAEVWVVDRYLAELKEEERGREETEGLEEEEKRREEMKGYLKELEDDSDEEAYLADVYGYDEMEIWNCQAQLVGFPEPPTSSVRDERFTDDFVVPFPSRYSTENYVELVGNLHDTVRQMGGKRGRDQYQTLCQAGQATIEDRGWRTNRFRRASTKERK